jgi:hypothetical protein
MAAGASRLDGGVQPVRGKAKGLPSAVTAS